LRLEKRFVVPPVAGMRALVFAFALAAAGCSSTPASSTPAPSVSFQTDVIPVFVASCAFNGCHNDPSGKPLEFLAEHLDGGPPVFAQQVYDGIVGKPSVEDPSMPFVTPGDPSKSFLMRKMDDDLAGLAAQCAPNNPLTQSSQNQMVPACGVSMPSQLPILEANRRDTVRSWIQQGAKNN
jgi:hypothetical protein